MFHFLQVISPLFSFQIQSLNFVVKACFPALKAAEKACFLSALTLAQTLPAQKELLLPTPVSEKQMKMQICSGGH